MKEMAVFLQLVVMSLVSCFALVSSHHCYIGAERATSDPAFPSRWVLTRRDPCECSTVRLGGHGVGPSGVVASATYLDQLFWSEDPEIIRRYFGCPRVRDITTPPGPGCEAPQALGLEHGTPLRILNSSFEASTIDQSGTYLSQAHFARLNFNGSDVFVGGWKPDDVFADLHPWIQVRLGRNALVTGVITQGRALAGGKDKPHWVTQYKVLYSNDENADLVPVLADNGTAKVFPANSDNDTPVTNHFSDPVLASTVRIVPTDFNVKVTLRFELLGCLLGLEDI